MKAPDRLTECQCLINDWGHEHEMKVFQKFLLCARAGLKAAKNIAITKDTLDMDGQMIIDVDLFIECFELSVMEEQNNGGKP